MTEYGVPERMVDEDSFWGGLSGPRNGVERPRDALLLVGFVVGFEVRERLIDDTVLGGDDVELILGLMTLRTEVLG